MSIDKADEAVLAPDAIPAYENPPTLLSTSSDANRDINSKNLNSDNNDHNSSPACGSESNQGTKSNNDYDSKAQNLNKQNQEKSNTGSLDSSESAVSQKDGKTTNDGGTKNDLEPSSSPQSLTEGAGPSRSQQQQTRSVQNQNDTTTRGKKTVAINPADILHSQEMSESMNDANNSDNNNSNGIPARNSRKSIIKQGKSISERKDKKNRPIGAQKTHSISFRDQLPEKGGVEDVVEVECWKEHNQMAQYRSGGTCCVIL